jgi:hypothetical protein
MLTHNICTNEDGFLPDETVERLHVEFAALSDFLTFSGFTRVGLAVVLGEGSDLGDSVGGGGEGLLETGVLCLDVEDHFEVVLFEFDLMLDEEGDFGRGLGIESKGQQKAAQQKHPSRQTGSHHFANAI